MENQKPDSSVETPDKTNSEELSRRQLGRLAVAGLASVAIPAAAIARESPSPNPQHAIESVSILPLAITQEHVDAVSQNPDVKHLLDHFKSQGFQFIHSRASTVVRNLQEPGEKLASPFLLTILPSFRKFKPTDPSHTALSIAVGEHNGKLGVQAVVVEVGHRPFRLLTISVAEVTKDGEIVLNTLSRKEIEGLSVSAAADKLEKGSILMLDRTTRHSNPQPISSRDPAYAVGAEVLKKLINDSYASPFYPKGAIESILSDVSTAMRFYQVLGLRYEGIRWGSNGPLGIVMSTSCCSNGCTTCCWMPGSKMK